MVTEGKPGIKVCGITRQQNMLQVAELNPDYMGFIFHTPSPRDVTTTIDSLPLHLLSSSIVKVAVMVDKPFEEALQIVTRNSFQMVQLHGSESPEYCDRLRKHVKVIKAFPVKDSLPKELEQYQGHCDFFLFDTKTEIHGGSGMMFNHNILNEYDGKVPFFLGGGIHPSFNDDLNGHTHSMLHALDINSRFESSPGIKDIQTLKEFFIRRSRNF